MKKLDTINKDLEVTVGFELSWLLPPEGRLWREREMHSELYSTSGPYDLLMKIYVPESADVGKYINEQLLDIDFNGAYVRAGHERMNLLGGFGHI